MDLIMKKGATGHEVKTLQQLLIGAGCTLTVDGWFGDATERAVQDVQRRAGLVVDGVAGIKTLEVLRGKANPARMTEADLVAAAHRLDVPLASIKAVNAVESRGSGFIDDSRPVILLERHQAYRQAKAAGLDADALAQRYPNLVNPARGGYAGGAAEWARFNTLRSVTSQAIAVEACSWGAFQIMGYHWDALGYDSAAEFQSRMTLCEGNHLDAFVRFIELDPALLKALKSHEWEDFARRYNGPAYADNLYDVKLARAYARFTEDAA